MFRLKLLSAAVLGLVLGVGAAMVHAEPLAPDSAQPGDAAQAGHADGANLTQRSLTAVGQAASKIGDAINTGAQAFGSGVHRVTGQAATLIEHAKQAIGVRYQWGGASAQTGFDCSGFVRAMVEKTVGKLLPHHAAAQAAVTQEISKDDLQPGDLVFFGTVRRRAYSHVGIYMGDGQFIHAPARGERVRIDNLSETYWQKHFEGARRVLTGDTSSSALSRADTPEPGLVVSKAVAASLAVFPGISTADTVADTAYDGGANNAEHTHPATNVTAADDGEYPKGALPTGESLASAAAATAELLPPTPRLDDTSSDTLKPSPRHAAAKHGRRTEKQTALRHGGKRGTLKTDSKGKVSVLGATAHSSRGTDPAG